MAMNDASKWHILCPAQSHTAGQSRGRAQQRLPPPLLACAQQIARCGGRLGVYYTFWRASGAGPSISYPAGTHMSPGEQGSGVCAKSGVLKQARRAPRRPDSSERRIDRDKARRRASASVGLRVFYWLVRGIFVSRRELPNKVAWGCWGAKWGLPVGARVVSPDLTMGYPIRLYTHQNILRR